MDATTIIDWISKSIGVLGGTLGVISYFRTHRREEDREMEESNDFNLIAGLMKKQLEVGSMAGPIYIEFEIGSDDWKRAEKLVRMGVF